MVRYFVVSIGFVGHTLLQRDLLWTGCGPAVGMCQRLSDVVLSANDNRPFAAGPRPSGRTSTLWPQKALFDVHHDKAWMVMDGYHCCLVEERLPRLPGHR